MKQIPQGAERYDFREYDQVWRRVAPGLEPYPGMGAGEAGLRLSAPNGTAAVSVPAGTMAEADLPGAEKDPCCMGTEAAELLAVLDGYIEEEREASRWYLFLSRQAPVWARQTLRAMAEDESGHARRLTAARYLITGEEVCPRSVCGEMPAESWRAALRRSYHEEVCTAMNYARTADSTPDRCLSELLSDLSAQEYRHAQQLLGLLERTLGCQGRN